MNRRELLATLAMAGFAGAIPGLALADDATDARDLWLYGLPIIEMATTRKRHLSRTFGGPGTTGKTRGLCS